MSKHLSVAVSALLIFASVSTSTFAQSGERDRALAEYSERIRNSIRKNLDFRTGGGGTDVLPQQLRAIAEEFRDGWPTEIENVRKKLPITFDDLRDHVLQLNRGAPAQVFVYDYERAVDFANERLKRSGIDFVKAVQAPEARLVEAVRDFVALVPKHKYSFADLKDMESTVMGFRGQKTLVNALAAGEAPTDRPTAILEAFWSHYRRPEIYVAMTASDIAAANEVIAKRYPPSEFVQQDGTKTVVAWRLVQDPEFGSDTLPDLGTVKGADVARYRFWESIRMPAMMGLSVLGATLPVAFETQDWALIVRYFPAIAAWSGLAATAGHYFKSRPDGDSQKRRWLNSQNLPLLAAVAAVGLTTIPLALNDLQPLIRFMPALIGGSVAAGLEFQFTRFSYLWAKFWDGWGIPGNILVNMAYPMIVSGAMLAAESGLGLPISLNVREFLVKTEFVGTLAFVASFGLMQIRASRDQAIGAMSNFKRFRLETLSGFWNGAIGRVVALTAAGAGVQYSIGTFMGAGFGVGEAIGWGIQLAYFGAVTAPMWTKSLVGRRAYDRLTRVAFESDRIKNKGVFKRLVGHVANACAYPLAKLSGSRLYSYSRTPSPAK